ncbi:MAG: hypothetical protein GY861_15880 [bacterium]|nr:hypothetical protein [bacterium]
MGIRKFFGMQSKEEIINDYAKLKAAEERANAEAEADFNAQIAQQEAHETQYQGELDRDTVKLFDAIIKTAEGITGTRKAPKVDSEGTRTFKSMYGTDTPEVSLRPNHKIDGTDDYKMNMTAPDVSEVQDYEFKTRGFTRKAIEENKGMHDKYVANPLEKAQAEAKKDITKIVNAMDHVSVENAKNMNDNGYDADSQYDVLRKNLATLTKETGMTFALSPEGLYQKAQNQIEQLSDWEDVGVKGAKKLRISLEKRLEAIEHIDDLMEADARQVKITPGTEAHGLLLQYATHDYEVPTQG